MDQSNSQYVQQLEAEVNQLRHESSRRSPWRQAVAYIFLVLGVITLIPASALIWANRSITDPARYIAITGPLIQEPSVQKAITKSANDAIFGKVDINAAVAQALPDKAQF